MPKKLLLPDDAKALLASRFSSQHRNWLAGEGAWPLVANLGVPTEKDVARDPQEVRRWVDQWSAYRGPGSLTWEERSFGRLGNHRFPGSLALLTPEDVARAVSAVQERRWSAASQRHRRLVAEWPSLGLSTFLRRNYDVLADYSLEDFERLVRLVGWLEANPSSGHQLRQLPVEGLDTKWIEPRRGLIMDMLQGVRADRSARDFYDLCGLRRPAHRLRLRLLCPTLRSLVGGLHDLEVPVDDAAQLPIRPRAAIVVENLETGLALPDMPGSVVLMKLGNAVSALGRLPWLRGVHAVYWGDIDTHGFAILDRARSFAPQLRSVLMDSQTLLAHRHLAVEERVQCPDSEMPLLTADERSVYEGLRGHTWGQNLRLEQERIPFAVGVAAIEHEVVAAPERQLDGQGRLAEER